MCSVVSFRSPWKRSGRQRLQLVVREVHAAQVGHGPEGGVGQLGDLVGTQGEFLNSAPVSERRPPAPSRCDCDPDRAT